MLSKPVRNEVLRLPGFSGLSQRERRLVAKSAHPMAFEARTTILEQGRVDRRVLVLLDGLVELIVDGESVGSAGRGTLLGDIVADSPRVPATVIAITGVRTVQIPSLVLRRLAARNSTVAYWLERDAACRGTRETGDAGHGG